MYFIAKSGCRCPVVESESSVLDNPTGCWTCHTSNKTEPYVAINYNRGAVNSQANSDSGASAPERNFRETVGQKNEELMDEVWVPNGIIIIIVTMLTFIIIATIITIYPAHENCKKEIKGRTDTKGGGLVVEENTEESTLGMLNLQT